MKLTEQQLKAIIEESIIEVMNQAAMAQNQNQISTKEKFQRVMKLNEELVKIKREADALQLENASKWIYMAIQSIDREYIGDSVRDLWNRGKEAVQGIFKEGND